MTTPKIQKLVAELREMTQHNLHTEAIVKICEVLGRPEHRFMAHAILKSHEEIGHLPQWLGTCRNNLYNDLFRYLGLILKKNEFNDIKMAL